MRRILGLPYNTHTRFLDDLSSMKHVKHILKCRFAKFVNALESSQNEKVVKLFGMCKDNTQSPTGLNIARIKHEYNVNTCNRQVLPSLRDLNNRYLSSNTLDIDDEWKIPIMKELIDTCHNTASCGLSLEEAKEMLFYIASV